MVKKQKIHNKITLHSNTNFSRNTNFNKLVQQFFIQCKSSILISKLLIWNAITEPILGILGRAKGCEMINLRFSIAVNLLLNIRKVSFEQILSVIV